MGRPICVRNRGNRVFLCLNIRQDQGRLLRDVLIDCSLFVRIKAGQPIIYQVYHIESRPFSLSLPGVWLE